MNIFQFVALSPDVPLEKVWKFLTEVWELSTPNAIVSLGGVFEKADSTWNEVANQAWLITNGSSPCQRSSNSCIIAIIPLNKVSNKEELFNVLPQVSYLFDHNQL